MVVDVPLFVADLDESVAKRPAPVRVEVHVGAYL